jgi:superfamily II DNA/RNA helicase
MQCGPVRFRVDAKSQAAARPFLHRVVLRTTEFAVRSGIEGERPPIQQFYAALASNDARNALIFDDVLKSLEEKRSPLILTERKDHALQLAERLSRFARNVVVLTGGMGVKQQRATMPLLSE